MSTFIHLLPQTLEADSQVETVEAQPKDVVSAKASGWEESFAEEQVRGLVRQVYLSGPKPSRQVVFAAVDRKIDVSELSLWVAEILSDEACGTTCLLNIDLQNRSKALSQSEGFRISSDHQRFGRLRDSSLQLSDKLWHMSTGVFLGEQAGGLSAGWLGTRFAELRLEFDYLVIQAPAAGTTNQAALFARLCDGLVLVVEANATRRVSAQRVRERLAGSRVRLLGTVLTERTFPIPQAIYTRV
jgi:hypothetical protein